MPKVPISLQLYTVRDLCAKDFSGTIAQVAKIGYKFVEMAGYGNLQTVKEVKKVLDDNGIQASGAHASIDELEGNLNKVLEENETLGHKNIICPWMPENRRKDAAGWKQCAEVLSKIGAACHSR